MMIYVYGVLIFAAIAGAWAGYNTVDSRGYERAKMECVEANRKQAQKEVDNANKAVEAFEQERAKARVVFKTITKNVDHYIDRPVYSNICLDVDGLRDANAALNGALTPAGDSDAALPEPNAPRRRPGEDGA